VTAVARSGTVAVLAVMGLSWAFTAHAEDAYEIMTGRVAVQSQPSSSPVLAYGENTTLQFPPRMTTPRMTMRPRATENTGQNSFCVRTCDGRYFPNPSQDKQSAAEGCKNLCPSSETPSMRRHQRMASLILPCLTRFATGKSWFRDAPVTARTSLDSQASKSKMTKRCVVVTSLRTRAASKSSTAREMDKRVSRQPRTPFESNLPSYP
jgi:hypothetical protein